MKNKSAKNKGKRLQVWVAKQISRITGIPCGKDELIESRPGSLSGTDVVLRGEAKEKFPFSIECKWQETWSIPAWVQQAKNNWAKGATDWLLFLRKNRHKEIVIMDAEAFFKIYKEYLQLKEAASCAKIRYHEQERKGETQDGTLRKANGSYRSDRTR